MVEVTALQISPNFNRVLNSITFISLGKNIFSPQFDAFKEPSNRVDRNRDFHKFYNFFDTYNISFAKNITKNTNIFTSILHTPRDIITAQS